MKLTREELDANTTNDKHLHLSQACVLAGYAKSSRIHIKAVPGLGKRSVQCDYGL